MLIISADDWGRNPVATDRILTSFKLRRISAAGAMLFMADSARAAAVANEHALDVGLHVNFSEEFTDPQTPTAVRFAHGRIRRFLRTNKYALVLYHPFLRRDFSLVFSAQLEAFTKLYHRAPTHFDGHQHMHLCTNVLMQRLLPRGTPVRRSFSFEAGQKGLLNLAYRKVVDRHLTKHYRTTDYFFATSSNMTPEKIRPICQLGQQSAVELMVHPEVTNEYNFLMSFDFGAILDNTPVGNFAG